MTTAAICDIEIIDPATGEVVDHCSGPLPDGRCPRALDGTRVPCAGHRLAPQSGTGLEGWRLHIVDHDLEECPIAVLTGSAQAYTPAVAPEASSAFADAELRMRVLAEILPRLSGFDSVPLIVAVHDGVVRLDGDVPCRSDALALGALARRVDGVAGVDNGLEWDREDVTVAAG